MWGITPYWGLTQRVYVFSADIGGMRIILVIQCDTGRWLIFAELDVNIQRLSLMGTNGTALKQASYLAERDIDLTPWVIWGTIHLKLTVFHQLLRGLRPSIHPHYRMCGSASGGS